MKNVLTYLSLVLISILTVVSLLLQPISTEAHVGGEKKKLAEKAGSNPVEYCCLPCWILTCSALDCTKSEPPPPPID